MFFIFEGPDGSGKTTLARDLERQGWHYHHEGPPPVPCPSLIEHYASLILNAPRNTVFDRLYLGEVIYGPILRGYDKIGGWMGIQMLNQLVWARGGKTIVFLPGLERTWKTIETRKGELIREFETHTKIYETYQRFADGEDMKYGKYDYMTDFGHGLGSPTLPHGMIGDLRAPVLLVGDVANSLTLDLPFFAEDGSSAFLRECLFRAGYKSTDFLLANSTRIDGTSWDVEDMVEQFWHPQTRPRIVALGNRAMDEIKNIADLKVNHPAYQKRFKSTETHDYIQSLREVLVAARATPRSLV